ncbi:MAG: tRNA pseudouridine(38-40) synthase TruA [Deltaproteobacteria bacterium]|nr:tRNA pseudouridine(38-40) synthase TruA [Deltaproteobacteria bacterium]
MQKLKSWRVWISYLGTRFSGSQHQQGLDTIESCFAEAFEQLLGKVPALVFAGRTDAGVHASGQVMSCTFESRFDERTLPLALSHCLGPDINVWRADEISSRFNAKRHSVGKRYVYRISSSTRALPFERLFTWHLRQALDLEAMQKAARYLIGEHDFESFRSSQCVAPHARRTIWKIDVKNKDEHIEIDIRGNAFCHNMVRIIVGTLVEVGQGKIPPKQMEAILKAKDRSKAGRTAPPHGLSLDEVYYPDNLTQAEIPENSRFPRFPVTKESWPC